MYYTSVVCGSCSRPFLTFTSPPPSLSLLNHNHLPFDPISTLSTPYQQQPSERAGIQVRAVSWSVTLHQCFLISHISLIISPHCMIHVASYYVDCSIYICLIGQWVGQPLRGGRRRGRGGGPWQHRTIQKPMKNVRSRQQVHFLTVW